MAESEASKMHSDLRILVGRSCLQRFCQGSLGKTRGETGKTKRQKGNYVLKYQLMSSSAKSTCHLLGNELSCGAFATIVCSRPNNL